MNLNSSENQKKTVGNSPPLFLGILNRVVLRVTKVATREIDERIGSKEVERHYKKITKEWKMQIKPTERYQGTQVLPKSDLSSSMRCWCTFPPLFLGILNRVVVKVTKVATREIDERIGSKDLFRRKEDYQGVEDANEANREIPRYPSVTKE